MCSPRVPKTTPTFGDLLEGHRTQNIVLLTSKVYHDDVVRIQNQIIRGKAQADSGGIHGQASLCCLPPMRGHMQCALSLSDENAAVHLQCSCPGKPIREPVPKVFSWGLVM